MKHKKTIWITGATSGIGFDLATSLIEQGHSVIVSGRRSEKLLELKRTAPELVSMVKMDLMDADLMSKLAEDLADLTDSLDTVILCAGTCEYVDRPDESEALYRRVLETNFLGQINCYLAALPLLRKSEHRAQIVGVGSLSVLVPFPRAQAYGASKAAFEYWLGSMRIDLVKEKIDVSIVSPGFVDTPLTKKNDFSMPGIIGVAQSTQHILKGIERRDIHICYPRRLYWTLRLMSFWRSLWFRKVTPRLIRQHRL